MDKFEGLRTAEGVNIMLCEEKRQYGLTEKYITIEGKRVEEDEARELAYAILRHVPDVYRGGSGIRD